jgi:hypothetical protein
MQDDRIGLRFGWLDLGPRYGLSTSGLLIPGPYNRVQSFIYDAGTPTLESFTVTSAAVSETLVAPAIGLVVGVKEVVRAVGLGGGLWPATGLGGSRGLLDSSRGA